jgi:PKD domain
MPRLQKSMVWGALLAFAAIAAQAATANFQGNCSNSTVGGVVYTSCLFSPNKAPAGEPFTSCGGAGVSSYDWVFGDGSNATTIPGVDFGRASHTYVAISGTTVTLTVNCSNGATASKSRCLDNTPPPTVGCIYPGAGWTP